MTFIVDIDDTLLVSKKSLCSVCDKTRYSEPVYDVEEIMDLQQLYREGNTIILHTGRGWPDYDLTVRQLELAGIPYHQLVMGKPLGIYIDKDAKTSLKEFCQ